MTPRQDVLKDRLEEILACLASDYPDAAVTVDIWRPSVVNRTGFPDEQTEVWVRVAETADAFYVEKMERWFERDIGIYWQQDHYLLMAGGYGISPDDHIILKGESYLVSEIGEQCGIQKLRIDKGKSRFIMPTRTTATYRQVGIKARIT